jgi:hypothetical protein
MNDEQSFQQHREYIDNNPVKAGFVNTVDEYPYGSACLKKRKHTGAEARELGATERHDSHPIDEDLSMGTPVKSCPDTLEWRRF